MNTCSKCKWFKKDATQAIPVGQCRFNPPQLLMRMVPVDKTGKPITSKLETPAGMVENPTAYFPLIAPGEYCGQFQPLASAMN